MNSHKFIARRNAVLNEEQRNTIRERRARYEKLYTKQGLSRFAFFKLIKELGSGGLAKVYSSQDIDAEGIAFDVAVKIFSPDLGSVDREFLDFTTLEFKLEAEAMTRIDSPRVVRAYNANIETGGAILTDSDGRMAFAMELIKDAVTLKNLVEKKGPLPFKPAAEMAIQICDGLTDAHRQGIIHRDIKPHNCLAIEDKETGSFQIKIFDFGLARDFVSSDNEKNEKLKVPRGSILGSVPYISPRIWTGQGDDTSVDAYAAMMTYLELLNPWFFDEKRALNQNDKVLAWMRFHKDRVMPLDTTVPESLRKYIAHALQNYETELATPQKLKEGLTDALKRANLEFQQVALVLGEVIDGLDIPQVDKRQVPIEQTPIRYRMIRIDPNLIFKPVGLASFDIEDEIEYELYAMEQEIANSLTENDGSMFFAFGSLLAQFNGFRELNKLQTNENVERSELPSFRKLQQLFDRDPVKKDNMTRGLIEEGKDRIIFPVSEYVAAKDSAWGVGTAFETDGNIKIVMEVGSESATLFNFDYADGIIDNIHIPPELVVNLPKKTSISINRKEAYVGTAFASLNKEGKFELVVPSAQEIKEARVILRRKSEIELLIETGSSSDTLTEVALDGITKGNTNISDIRPADTLVEAHFTNDTGQKRIA